MSSISKEYAIGAFIGGAAFALAESVLTLLIRKIVELTKAVWNSISLQPKSYQIKNPRIIN